MHGSHRVGNGWCRKASNVSALALPLIVFVLSGCFTSPQSTAQESNEARAVSAVVPPCTITVGVGDARDARAKQSLESLRAPMPTAIPIDASIAAAPTEFVSAVRSALAVKDLPRAAEAVVALLRVAPQSAEAREALVRVQMLQHNAEGTRKALEELRAVDPVSPLLCALEGVELQHRGESDKAASLLAWFVGADALSQETTLGAFPLGAAEIQEALMNACFDLGATEAATEAARAVLAKSEEMLPEQSVLRSAMRARILLGDIAFARGNRTAALELWQIVAVSDGFEAELARWRLASDAVREGSAAADEECLRILADPSALRRDEPALLRVAWIASHAREDGAFKYSIERAAEIAASLPEDLRLQCIAARLGDPSARARLRGQTPDAWKRDPFAYRLALAGAAADSATDAAELACASVRNDPAALPSAARGLAWSGLHLDALQQALASSSEPTSQALWVAVLAICGLPEDALARPASTTAASLVVAASLRDTSLVEAAVASMGSDADVAQALAPLLIEAWRESLDPLRAVDTAERAALRVSDPNDERELDLRTHFLYEAARGRVETGTASKQMREVLRAQVLAGSRDAEIAWLTLAAVRGDDCPPPPTIALRALVAADFLAAIGSPLAADILALAAECSPSCTAIARLRVLSARGDSAAERVLSALSRAHPADAALARETAATSLLALTPLEQRRMDRAIAFGVGTEHSSLDRSAFARPTTTPLMMSDAERAARESREADALRAVDAVLAQVNTPDSVLVRAFALLVELRAAEGVDAPAVDRLVQVVVQRLIASTSPIAPLWAVAVYDTVSAQSSDPDELITVAEKLAPRVEVGVQGAAQCYLLTARLLAREEPEFPAIFAHTLAKHAIADPLIRAQLARHAVALDAIAGGREIETFATLRAVRALGVDAFAREGEELLAEAECLHRASGTYSMLGNDAGAAVLMQESLRIDPDHAGSLNNLAYAALERGELTEACERAAIRAAQRAPDNASHLDTLGVLRYRKGELQDGSNGPGAITLFRTALRLAPRDPSIATMLHLGDALWLSGDQAGAVKCWQQIGQIATLRYPPREIAQSLAAFQQAQFGMQFVDPSEFLRREYGATVESAEHRLQSVSRGETPVLGASKAVATPAVNIDAAH